MTNQPNSLPPTEQRNPLSTNLDELSTLEMVRLMNRLDAAVPLAVAEALPQIAQAVEQITLALTTGGRLFYMGAGTSGRLAVLDASELLPTFSLPSGVVIPLMAGGVEALTRSIEGAEDDPAQGQHDLMAHNFCAQDILVGVAASGRTPYVLGGLHYATALGAPTISLVCNPNTPMAQAAQLAIEVIPGPEVLTGSTRLRAGTAQKLVLNMLSTAVMIKMGKVYSNLMVDVRPTNAKLRQRAIRIVEQATGKDAVAAEQLLLQADWRVKTAVLCGLTGLSIAAAEQRLLDCGGNVRSALLKNLA